MAAQDDQGELETQASLKRYKYLGATSSVTSSEALWASPTAIFSSEWTMSVVYHINHQGGTRSSQSQSGIGPSDMGVPLVQASGQCM